MGAIPTTATPALRRLAACGSARVAIATNEPVSSVPLRGVADDGTSARSREALEALRAWARQQGMSLLAAQCDQAAAESPVGQWVGLRGPTGEANLYAVLPREEVLCLTEGETHDADLLVQLAAVLAVGSQAVWPAQAQTLRERLPEAVREHVALAQDWTQSAVQLDAVLCHGSAATLLAVAASLAARAGPIVGLTGMEPGDTRIPLERLVIERSLSINTAAAGGNASLMTIA